ncbi:MAG: SRPBCC family protein [Hyphomicrobiaceae bacterium]|nr:SRPBCC family protein [Hyphomicrobiaceae bacterium]
MLGAAAPADAHGPTRQKVAQTVEINAPAAKVWERIGNFQDMSWHPAVAKTEGTGGNADGATRTLTLASGGTIKEKLIGYDATRRQIKYEITEVDVKVLPVNNYSSTITVEEAGGKSTVTWRGAFYRGYMNNDPPADLNDEAAVAAVNGVYKAGLEALKASFGAGG